MQTFMPFPSRRMSASILDNKRLNKQITEALQIYNCLKVKPSRWKNHPAVLMWKGYEVGLLSYGLACYQEWQDRFDTNKRGGKRDHKSGEKIIQILQEIRAKNIYDKKNAPKWIFNQDLNTSHQSNLIRKYPEYYSKLFPGVPNDIPYVWPTNNSR